jgi:hypothetical protein
MFTRLAWPWIWFTWNPNTLHGILSNPLYHQILHQVGNLYPTPSTLWEWILMLVYKFFIRPFKPMEKDDVDNVNLFCFTLCDAISEWGRIL